MSCRLLRYHQDRPFPRPAYRHLLVIILVNLVLRGIWLWFVHPPQVSDFEWYYEHAAALARGQGYTMAGHPTAYWPIGWPLFLSLVFRVTGPSWTAGLVTQVLLSTGIVCVVYLIALRVWRRQWPALAAAWAYTLLPSQIEWNAVLGSEELFTLFLVLGLWLYLRARDGTWGKWAPWAALTLGVACDVRPLPLLFPVAVWLYEWFIDRQGFIRATGRAAVLAVGMLVAVVPVTIRNLVSMHHWVLVSTNGGVNLWQGIHADTGYYWPADPRDNPLLLTGTDEVRRDAMGTHLFVTYVRDHPVAFAVHALLKMWNLYRADDSALSWTLAMRPGFHGTAALAAWQTFNNVSYYVFMALALLGVIRALAARRTRRCVGFLLCFVLYYTLVFCAFPAWDRFRYPVMPLFAVFIGAVLSWPWGSGQPRGST